MMVQTDQNYKESIIILTISHILKMLIQIPSVCVSCYPFTVTVPQRTRRFTLTLNHPSLTRKPPSEDLHTQIRHNKINGDHVTVDYVQNRISNGNLERNKTFNRRHVHVPVLPNNLN